MLAQIMHHPQLSGGKAHRALRAVLGEGHLIVMSGPEHRRRSQLLRRVLTKFSEDDQVTRICREEWSQVRPGDRFCLYQSGHRISLKVILHALLGADPDPELLKLSQQFQNSFSNSLLLFLPFLRRDWGPLSPWGRLLRRRERLQHALMERLLGASADCMASRLQSGLAEDLPNELLALLMFGHETTAATFAWCCAHLTPERQHRIAEDTAYCDAFVEEALRLTPAVAQLTRTADCHLRLGSWEVAAGSVVMPAIPLAHHQCSQPESFSPERFLGASLPPQQYCPFGFGSRICPGKPMALRQLRVMLQTMVREFDFEIPASVPRPQRRLFLVLPRGGPVAVRRA